MIQEIIELIKNFRGANEAIQRSTSLKIIRRSMTAQANVSDNFTET
jgi:hypothetical protein